MATLKIEGGRRLEGSVAVEGNKNAALPLLAACLLTDEECVLTNVPRISDVEVMARLLLDLGATVDGHRHHDAAGPLRVDVTTDGPDASAGRPAARLGAAARSAARAARTARLAPPGGDFPARRTIATHLQALAAMGAVHAR